MANEKVIIKYLKQNKKRGIAFMFMPEDVQAWCRSHNDLLVLTASGNWVKTESIHDYYINSIFSLDDDYKPAKPFKAHWETFDIDDNGFFTYDNRQYHYQEPGRFAKENLDKFKGFGGYMFTTPDNQSFWDTSLNIVTKPWFATTYHDAKIHHIVKPLLPLKISFWRISE